VKFRTSMPIKFKGIDIAVKKEEEMKNPEKLD
jgi:hypothetical protein